MLDKNNKKMYNMYTRSMSKYNERSCKYGVFKNRKNNINSNYTLALQDFRVIDNIEDTIETLEEVISKLDDLQERIQTRNKRNLI